MFRESSSTIEEAIISLANTGDMKKGKDIEIEDYQRVNLYIYDNIILTSILNAFKFKDAGNIYDYPDYIKPPESINGYLASLDNQCFQKLAVSNKYNSIVYYNKGYYSIDCMFLIDLKHLNKFLEICGKYIKDDSVLNEFKDADISYKPKSFVEIIPCLNDQNRKYDVLRKELSNENLVYDEKSTIYKVKQEIISFFSDETKKLYNKLELPHKRGIILYGDPGNGKSAMIREIIRSGPEVIKIMLGSSIDNIPYVLSSVIDALNGRNAIIIIEDLDSMITESNRSEFLNILDGVEMKSGVFIIGTTNYPEKIDAGFTNRSGRFDRMYKIENPSDDIRKLFFESRKLEELFGAYKISNKEKNKDLISMFVDNSKDLPMASLKEIITNTAYLLLNKDFDNVEDALVSAYKSITTSRDEQENNHNEFNKKKKLKMRNTGVIDL